MEEIKGVEIIRLLPEDKVLATFNTNIHTIETASQTYKFFSEAFEGHIVLGVYGADIKFIREEEENAENNDKEYFKTLRKGV
jgi:hypothetical protein